MTQLEPMETEARRRARNYRAAAAAACILGLAATLFIHAGPTARDSATIRAAAALATQGAADEDDYLRTLARDPSVPRAQDVFAATPTTRDETQAPTF